MIKSIPLNKLFSRLVMSAVTVILQQIPSLRPALLRMVCCRTSSLDPLPKASSRWKRASAVVVRCWR